MTDCMEKHVTERHAQGTKEAVVAESVTDKPHRTTEMQLGDTTFTIISVESDRARERLYDKVKRLILDSDASVSVDTSLPS